MKILKIILLVIVGLGIGGYIYLAYLGSGVQTQAENYNDTIISLDDEILKSFENLDDQLTAEEKSGDELEEERIKLADLIKNNTAKLTQTTLPLTDEGFKASMIEMFDLYQKWAEKDYKEMIGIYLTSGNSTGKQKRMEAVDDRIQAEQAKIYPKIKDAHQKMAKKYGFEIDYTETEK